MSTINPTAGSTFASACAEAASRTMPHERRLRRVIEHVYAHLDEPLDLMMLAEVAHLSPHHWHRIYHAMYGETLAATVKRLRLHRAAGWLANTALPIEQIARRSGYPNLQSFTRLFKGVYGLPPARYRAAGQHTVFSGPERVNPGPMRSVQIRSLPAQEVVAIDHAGSYMEIGRAFDAMLVGLAASGLARPGMRLFATYLLDPSQVPQADLRSQACAAGCGTGQPPALLQRITLAAGDYAVLVYTGPYASMHAAYQWLLGAWLPQSGRDPADLLMLEEYLNDPRDTAPADLVTHICLPLRPE